MSTIIALVVMAILLGYVIYSYRKMKNVPSVGPNQFITELDDKTLKSGISKGLVLVDFWAEWCIPCKMMAPILNELAEEMQGKVSIAKLDVDANRQSMLDNNIKGIPTMILFKDGKEIKRFVGAKTKTHLLSELNKAL